MVKRAEAVAYGTAGGVESTGFCCSCCSCLAPVTSAAAVDTLAGALILTPSVAARVRTDNDALPPALTHLFIYSMFARNRRTAVVQ